jgi:hypothetical protein
MGLFEFFWNLRQQQQIGSATTTASAAASEARAHESSLADLNSRFERLVLVTHALSELLAERAHVSEADLLAKIHEIDVRDGVTDGGAASGARSCPKCGHPNSGQRTACLYCGAALGPANPFAGL